MALPGLCSQADAWVGGGWIKPCLIPLGALWGKRETDGSTTQLRGEQKGHSSKAGTSIPSAKLLLTPPFPHYSVVSPLSRISPDSHKPFRPSRGVDIAETPERTERPQGPGHDTGGLFTTSSDSHRTSEGWGLFPSPTFCSEAERG